MSLLSHSLHPGEVLAELYLNPLGMSAASLAEDLDLPRRCIQKILTGKGRISADIAIRLGRLFSTKPEFWMNLQRNWDLNSVCIAPGASGATSDGRADAR